MLVFLNWCSMTQIIIVLLAFEFIYVSTHLKNLVMLGCWCSFLVLSLASAAVSALSYCCCSIFHIYLHTILLQSIHFYVHLQHFGASLKNTPSVCMHETTREQIHQFRLTVMLENFTHKKVMSLHLNQMTLVTILFYFFFELISVSTWRLRIM